MRAFTAPLLSFLILCTCVLSLPVKAAERVTPKQGRAELVVAILAQNDGTEITDFLVPHALLSEAPGTQVLAVSEEPGPISFWPALKAEPDIDLAKFDATWPEGADLIVVPAVHDPQNARLTAWLRAQAAKGAFIASICDGSLLLAESGVLDGHEATGHFYTEDNRRTDYPHVTWHANRRYVEDGRFLTSSGVSASLPASLRLVERIAGPAEAQKLAARYGIASYGPQHNSDSFNVGLSEISTALKNFLFGWPRSTYAVLGRNGMDEVDLAFAVDMGARSWESASSLAADGTELRTAQGLRFYPDMSMEEAQGALTLALPGDSRRADVTLSSSADLRRDMLKLLEETHGAATASFIATQIEYPLETQLP